jgi:hypothetical protein
MYIKVLWVFLICIWRSKILWWPLVSNPLKGYNICPLFFCEPEGLHALIKYFIAHNDCVLSVILPVMPWGNGGLVFVRFTNETWHLLEMKLQEAIFHL